MEEWLAEADGVGLGVAEGVQERVGVKDEKDREAVQVRVDEALEVGL